MFVAFLKRLTGTDERALEAERRFSRNLNGMAKKNEELDRLTAQVDAVIERVDSQGMRQRNSLPSGVSGEHRLELPVPPTPPQEVHVHVRDSTPDQEEGPPRT